MLKIVFVENSIVENPVADINQGIDKDLSKATINVFFNALSVTGNNTKTENYKIKNKLGTSIHHETFGISPYNLFIMVHDNTEDNRCEVHLINNKPIVKLRVWINAILISRNGLASMVANVRIGISRKILFKVIIRNYAASCTMHGSCVVFLCL